MMGITKGILGIDPGANGGFVLLSRDGVILEKHVMPANPEGGIDSPELSRLFFNLSEKADYTYIEKIHAMHKVSAGSSFNFGMNFGILIGNLNAFRMSHSFVSPAEWQKVMHEGHDSKLPAKLRSAMAGHKLFPGADLREGPRNRINHDGLVDALLIAEYGRRTHKLYDLQEA